MSIQYARGKHKGVYPRLQLLTIKGLLEGTQHLQRPLHVREVTFKKAPRSRSEAAKNLSRNLSDD